jgi:hypothetical protein
MLTLERCDSQMREKKSARDTGPATATLSLDLDNRWSYLKTHGNPKWEHAPSYLPLVVPRVLDLLNTLDIKITWFIVGRDAEMPENLESLQAIVRANHEIANHSYNHEPWLHLYSPCELEEEIERAETAITKATGQRPVGFRGPGFSYSDKTLEILAARGYLYDASLLPTFIGPLARIYYFLTARLSRREREKRAALFGSFRQGLRPNRAFRIETNAGLILQIPVTTLPLLRTPIHVSYLVYLSSFCERAADQYCRIALALCRLTGTHPSWLLHPLDFLGSEEAPDLSFFPGMNISSTRKIARVSRWLKMLKNDYEVCTLRTYASRFAASNRDGRTLNGSSCG